MPSFLLGQTDTQVSARDKQSQIECSSEVSTTAANWRLTEGPNPIPGSRGRSACRFPAKIWPIAGSPSDTASEKALSVWRLQKALKLHGLVFHPGVGLNRDTGLKNLVTQDIQRWATAFRSAATATPGNKTQASEADPCHLKLANHSFNMLE